MNWASIRFNHEELAFVAPEAADAVLTAMRSRPESAGAVRTGQAVAEHPRRALRTSVGATRK